MIESLTPEAIEMLIEELRIGGYIDVKEKSKAAMLKIAAEEAYGDDVFVCSELSGCLYKIADWLTENYRNKDKRGMKKVTVDVELEEEYKDVLVGFLKVMQPYYGRVGFRSRSAI